MVSHTSRTMLRLYALTALLSSQVHVNAAPKVVGLEFKKPIPQNKPLKNLLRRQKTVSVDLDNQSVEYLINMTVGTPPQPFSVQIDTGSSDIWIPSTNSDACEFDSDSCTAHGSFDGTKSSTLVEVAQDAFQIQYEDKSGVTGDYISDILTIGSTSIRNMTMGLASMATMAVGVMGIGYVADESIAATDSIDKYPNIINQLRDQGYINTLAYSLWLNDLDSLSGSILFGGIDTAKFHGSLGVLPVQKSSDDSYRDFTVALSSISLTDAAGKVAFAQSNLALPAILDSGTTDTYLPDDVANPIISGVGAIGDPDLGLIVPCSLGSSPANFSFGFGGSGGPTIAVSFGEFVTPVSLQDGSQPVFEGSREPICGFGLMSSGTGPIILGDTFLRSAYVVYDLSNNQIGMAQTEFNTSSSNVVEISGNDIPNAGATATGVAITQTYLGYPLKTDSPTKTGGARATAAHGRPTFNLGAGTTGNGGKEGAAATLQPPRSEALTIRTNMACLISLVFGSSVVLMI